MISSQLFLQIEALCWHINMSSGGKGDKPDKVNWPARDWRIYGAKPKGQPKSQPKPASQPKPKSRRGGADCSLCSGVCCRVARALIAEAFGLGCIVVSPIVS